MTTIRMNVGPDQTPEEEAALVARVAAAVAESTGEDTVAFELTESESVSVAGDVGHRMSQGSRWSA
jgi:phenylpyruvate tautomerase PptA (4-oxalocrotonate tautomerase family)